MPVARRSAGACSSRRTSTSSTWSHAPHGRQKLFWLTSTSPTRPSAPPCPDLSVAQVAAHLIGGMRGFASVADGGELRFDTDLDPDFAAERPAVLFRSAAHDLLAAFGVPGRIEATLAGARQWVDESVRVPGMLPTVSSERDRWRSAAPVRQTRPAITLIAVAMIATLKRKARSA